MLVLDTDVLVEHLQGKQAALDYLDAQINAKQMLGISVITLTELLSSVRVGEEALLQPFLKLFFILDINEVIGRTASDFLRNYRTSHKLRLSDAFIAATVLHSTTTNTLITLNPVRYPMQEIKVVTPY